MADGIRSQSRSVTTPGTFRDPSGSAVLEPDRVLRYLTETGHSALMEFLESPLAVKLTEDGSIVATHTLRELRGVLEGADPDNRARRFTHVVQHDRIPVVSYPCEWSAEQLFDAGRLTLDLAEQALQHGFVLKDATPYNVLFHNGRPVFVDIPSFARKNPLACAWGAGGQFTRQFLLPLLAHKLGFPKIQSSFLTHRDGLEARELCALPGFSKFLKRGYISMVAGPLLLERFSKRQSEESSWEPVASTPEKAEYTMRWLIGSFRRQLRAVEPKRSVSTHWSTYQQKVPSYSPEEFARKREFVDEVLGVVKPLRVLDTGCNEGLFSRAAAAHGASVVAFDQDEAAVGALYRETRSDKLPILPLVLDLARPTPAHGWRNQEFSSFLERARGQFDLVLALAVLHHLLVTNGVPLPEVLDFFGELSSRHILLEYVDPADAHFKMLLRGRDAIHAHLTRDYFEGCVAQRFQIVRTLEVKRGLRWIYLLKKP